MKTSTESQPSRKKCPKCGSKVNAIDFTPHLMTTEIEYITCDKCDYQTWEPKHKERNGFIHDIKELYKKED